MSKKYLVTGVAGFIASQVSKQLLDQGERVVGVDNLNDYYDVRLKNWRLEQLKSHPNAENFSFARLDIEDRDKLSDLFQAEGPFDAVLNLAARAGVRYSMETLMYTFQPMPKVPSTYSSVCGLMDAKNWFWLPHPPFMPVKKCHSPRTWL